MNLRKINEIINVVENDPKKLVFSWIASIAATTPDTFKHGGSLKDF